MLFLQQLINIDYTQNLHNHNFFKSILNSNFIIILENHENLKITL